MRISVVLDKEQLEEIASITADKVLATVKYCRDRNESYEKDIKRLEYGIQQRDHMLVSKDFMIDRLRERNRALLKVKKEHESK